MARNKFGVHVVVDGSHDWLGADLERCAKAGQPFALVKAMFDKGALGQAKSVSRDTYTIYRVCIDDDRDFPATDQGSWYWESSAACKASALDWMHKCDILWNGEREKIDAFELVNEPNPTDEKLGWFAEWSAYCLDEAERLGYRLAWGSFSTGCPTENEMISLLPFVSMLATRGHILAMHDGAVKSPFTFRAAETDPNSDRANSALRYRWWKARADEAGLSFPRVAITEDYAYGRQIVPAFYDDWQWYLTELAKNDYLIGVAWYTLGNGGMYGNIAGEPMARVVDRALAIDYGAIEPPPPPPPPVSNDIVLQVPFTSQVNEITYNACGPACAAILELYQYDIARTALDWWAATGANPTQPVTFAQMERAANSFGYHFRIERDKSLSDLENLLKSGTCPMLLVNAAYLEYCATTSAHFVLCVGKLASGAYMIHDPYTVRQMGGAFVIQHDLVNAWGNCYLQGNPNNTWLILEKAIEPPPSPPDTAMSGVGMGSARPLTANETEAMRISGVTAFKALTIQDPGEAAQLIEQARYIKSDMLIVARLMFPPDSENHTPFSPQTFVDYCGGPALAYYSKGVRHFEIHNEPNLALEGNGWNWANGIEFAEWFDDVFYILRRMMPNAMLGFPGLSPQVADMDWCEASDTFLQNARSAVLAADWLGVHSYWQERGTGHWQMQSEDYGGWYYRKVQRMFPDKQLFLTEYSCNNPNVPDVEKGRMYREYLADLPGVEAAFAFCLSWDYDANREAFVRGGNITDIPRALGGLL